MDIEEKLNHLSEFLQYRTDIVCNNPDYWLSGTQGNYLPTFEYYIQNCVLDKGGAYDFTKRRYKTHAEVIIPITHSDKPQMNQCQKKVFSSVEFSRWHFTAFNFKQKVELSK